MMKTNQFWEKSYTPVHFPKAPFTLSPQNHLSFWGSCFAEELSRRYNAWNLPFSTAPFGNIYNPLSLGKCLLSLGEEKLEGDPFFQMDLWRHFDFHSSRCYRHSDNSISPKEAAQAHFQRLLSHGKEELNRTDFLVVTLGTAWAYRLKETGRVVNNCHRCDNRFFERENYQKWDETKGTGTLGIALEALKREKPSLQVILTVSPVRHLRNDARENSYSKALLRCLCEELCSEKEWCHYFPSYEIVMDEMRDYRWYAEDLSHLSPMAIDYIMSRFLKWAGGDEFIQHIDRREKERKRLNHRPLT